MTKPLNRGPASLLHWLACVVLPSYDGEARSRRGVDRPLKSRDARDEWSGPYCNAKTKLLPCSMEKEVGQKCRSRGRIKPFSRLNIYSWILHITVELRGIGNEVNLRWWIIAYCSKLSGPWNCRWVMSFHAYEIFKSLYFPSPLLLSFGEIGWVYLFTINLWKLALQNNPV